MVMLVLNKVLYGFGVKYSFIKSLNLIRLIEVNRIWFIKIIK